MVLKVSSASSKASFKSSAYLLISLKCPINFTRTTVTAAIPAATKGEDVPKAVKLAENFDKTGIAAVKFVPN